MTQTRTKLPLKDRLEKHIISKKNCWLINLKTNNTGFPVITIEKKSYLCHRIAYEIYHGPIPKNRFVSHKCWNKTCINPEHLILMTSKELGK